MRGGIMFFRETRREIHKALIRDREQNVRFNEMLIESYQKMEKLYRSYPDHAGREKANEYRKMVSQWKSNLALARGRLAQAKREYDEMYRDKQSLPLIQSGIFEET
jgi:outer membrane cobalamin receptor